MRRFQSRWLSETPTESSVKEKIKRTNSFSASEKKSSLLFVFLDRGAWWQRQMFRKITLQNSSLNEIWFVKVAHSVPFLSIRSIHERCTFAAPNAYLCPSHYLCDDGWVDAVIWMTSIRFVDLTIFVIIPWEKGRGVYCNRHFLA